MQSDSERGGKGIKILSGLNKNTTIKAVFLFSAGDGGIEPPPKVLETFVLPLN